MERSLRAQAQPGGRRRRSARGQSLVELSLILPVLLILALGIVDYGRVYFEYVSVTNAARTGAAFASKDVDTAADLDGIRTAALDDLDSLPNGSGGSAEVTATTGTDANGDLYTQVTVRKQFDTLVPWPLLPGDFDIERTVQMRVGE
jgi:Flp pilus assembly protein TadG